VGIVLLAGLAVFFAWPRPATRTLPPRAPEPAPEPVTAAAAALPAAPSVLPAGPPSLPPPPAGLSDRDAGQALVLAAALKSGRTLSTADVDAALDLAARYPHEENAQALAENVLLTASRAARARRMFAEALRLAERATALRPDGRAARIAVVEVLLESEDWTGAEAAARAFLALAPADAEGLRALGYALMRQDRNREAVEALRGSLEVREDPAVRALLGRVEKGLADERGMSEKKLAHFHVRYDGGEHADVGQEILRALDRHYAALTSVFDHQPTTTIPVILFAQEAYYDAAGAPRWSGGAFNHLDGRIRIPIGGLTSSLTPDIDDVLIHELAHAFIADIAKGACPRDVHEGLAQYSEGKRVAEVLDRDQLRILADGRAGGVSGFYLYALAFVEYLVAQRGRGGVNDLLRAMGETGSADQAFERVYGQGHAATQRAARARLKQQHGT
jgi:hypothetical protein